MLQVMLSKHAVRVEGIRVSVMRRGSNFSISIAIGPYLFGNVVPEWKTCHTKILAVDGQPYVVVDTWWRKLRPCCKRRKV